MTSTALLLTLLAAPAEPSRLSALCPLGDHEHVSVYDFVWRELAHFGPPSRTREEVRALAASEAARPRDEKPRRAGIVETQLSHAITALCASEPACASAAVYDASGVAVALSSKAHHVDTLAITDDAQWAAMSAASAEQDGLVAPLGCPEAKALGLRCGRRLWSVAFPAYEGGRLRGVVRCVIDSSRGR